MVERANPDLAGVRDAAALEKLPPAERAEWGRLWDGVAGLVRVAREVVTEMVEGAQVAPEMTSGFTDSRIYRKRGVEAYGFVPCLVSPEE